MKIVFVYEHLVTCIDFTCNLYGIAHRGTKYSTETGNLMRHFEYFADDTRMFGVNTLH